MLGGGPPRIETPDGKVKWQWGWAGVRHVSVANTDVLFEAIRTGKPKNDDLNLATSTSARADGPSTPRTPGNKSRGTRRSIRSVSPFPKPVDWKREPPSKFLVSPFPAARKRFDQRSTLLAFATLFVVVAKAGCSRGHLLEEYVEVLDFRSLPGRIRDGRGAD